MFILTLFVFGVISFNCVKSYPTGEYAAKEGPSEQFLEVTPNVKLFRAANKTYYFAPTFVSGTYFQAVQFCNAQNMKLLSIESKEESDLLLTAFQTFLNRKSFYAIWTSGTRLPNDEWMWLSTGYNMLYTNWADSQPDLGNEKCVEAYYEPSDNSLFWHDWSCEASAHVVCESSFLTPINIIIDNEDATDSNVDDATAPTTTLKVNYSINNSPLAKYDDEIEELRREWLDGRVEESNDIDN